jgi:hypothetical protein
MDPLTEAFADDLLIDKVVNRMIAGFIAEGKDPRIVDTAESRAVGKKVARRALDEWKKDQGATKC